MNCDLRGLDFSALHIRQAYLAGQSLPAINFSRTYFKDCAFTATFGNILSLAFSPDGTFLATGAANCEIRVWKVGESTTLLACKGHAHWIWTVAYSPDGQLIASGSEDQTVCLWNAETGDRLHVLSGHTDPRTLGRLQSRWSPPGQRKLRPHCLALECRKRPVTLLPARTH